MMARIRSRLRNIRTDEHALMGTRPAKRAAVSNANLFTPGPVRVPEAVSRAMADPPCNYHRQDSFREMFARTQSALKTLIGLRTPNEWFATILTGTGTAANEACLLALSGRGRGLIVENGFFGRRLLDQARANAIAHVALALPHDRPIDPLAVAEVIAREEDLAWVYFVGHETRAGLKNPLEAIGRICRERGLLVGADVISAAFAYPIDIERAQLDLATTSSAKAIMGAAGLGIVFTRHASVAQLKKTGSYYLDLVAEYEKQRAEMQPRFAQPVPLHAALDAACRHLLHAGIEAHFTRIRLQMDRLVAHLARMGIEAQLAPSDRSFVAVNFGLPEGLAYTDFARRMEREGYFVLYGIPGDDRHFQLSTIGDLTDAHVAGLESALTKVLAPHAHAWNGAAPSPG
jgi:2-aminoethylphosphonate-pyruvate transaminase